MYEKYTYEFILDRLLNTVIENDSGVDVREGSVIYNALAPCAIELVNMYIEADFIMNETFADTASREYLIKRVKERGIIPMDATKAILKGNFAPLTLNIPIGSRFSLDDLNYKVINKISDGQYQLECEEEGVIGNSQVGVLVPIDYIDKLTKAELIEVLIPGEDEESTDSIRKRYYNSLSAESYGGNKADYKYKVSLLKGVGGVKVYSGTEWNGGGTVKIVVTDSNFEKPSQTLIENIQNIIDPITNHGEGIGIAPIGHIVTVMGVNEQTVDIVSEISYQVGYTWEDVKTSVENAIDNYFFTLNEQWEDSENIIVRISKLETELLNVQGIIDVMGTTLNGVEENLTIEKDSIVLRGIISGKNS